MLFVFREVKRMLVGGMTSGLAGRDRQVSPQKLFCNTCIDNVFRRVQTNGQINGLSNWWSKTIVSTKNIYI